MSKFKLHPYLLKFDECLLHLTIIELGLKFVYYEDFAQIGANSILSDPKGSS